MKNVRRRKIKLLGNLMTGGSIYRTPFYLSKLDQDTIFYQPQHKM